MGFTTLSRVLRDRRGCDCKVVRFTTTYAISAYDHWDRRCRDRMEAGLTNITTNVVIWNPAQARCTRYNIM